MTSQQIFGLQVLLSFAVYGLVARWYVSPRLAALPLEAALQPLLVLHAFRHLGLVFLVPTVVGPALPASFAVPAAYGDLLAGLLALAALATLRAGSRIALALTWLFSVVGLLDLINAFYQGAVERRPARRRVLHPHLRRAGPGRHACDDPPDARPAPALIASAGVGRCRRTGEPIPAMIRCS